MKNRVRFKPTVRWLGFTVLALITAGLAGCGGGGSSDKTSNGQAQMSLTDAAGDFDAYIVNVNSLTMTKQDGTVVETIPQTTQVDFTQLADLSEFFTAASVPSGKYKTITMQLDYTNADIEVDNGTSTPVKVTNIQDRNGSPITTLTVTLNLDNGHPLVIAPGLPSVLQLDFNLAASNSVDVTNPASPVVTVDPVLVGSLSLDTSKPHRLRGPFVSADPNNSTFALHLRPFHLNTGDFGQMTIYTNANTVFEINETSYVGAAGLAQLATEPTLTAVAALVTPDTATGHLVASEVYAGSSVAFGTSDVVSGNVVARSGDVLTVRGASLVRTDGTLTFHDTVTVTMGLNTKVTKQGVKVTGLTKENISVGQRIAAFGVWDNTASTLNATDPTKGPVRMLITQLNGDAVSVSGQTLTMILNRINGRPISLFNFTGTGTPDATSSSYVVNVASGIDLSAISNGTPLRARGFVAPFGGATATDDFDASTIINVAQAPGNLEVSWPRANDVTAPFSTYTSEGMVLDLTESGLIHLVDRTGVITNISISATPTVEAKNPEGGIFVIGSHGIIQLFTTLASYQSALQSDLASGMMARFFGGHGTYDDATSTMTADAMLTQLE